MTKTVQACDVCGQEVTDGRGLFAIFLPHSLESARFKPTVEACYGCMGITPVNGACCTAQDIKDALSRRLP